MMTKTYKLETLTCPSCVAKIEKAVSNLEGVSEVEVLFNASKVKVNFETEKITGEKIKDTLSNLGFPVLSEK